MHRWKCLIAALCKYWIVRVENRVVLQTKRVVPRKATIRALRYPGEEHFLFAIP